MKRSEKKLTKVVFVDRDGTMIYEPPDTKQVDSLDQLKILPGTVEGLKRLVTEGYGLVMVTNQNGIGTSSFPKKDFDAPQKRFEEILAEQGITFNEVLICPHFPSDSCACRKPKLGLVKKLLKEKPIDLKRSFVVGDRETDMQFAKNIGIAGYLTETNTVFPRIATVERDTKETKVSARCNLDGRGVYEINTGINFFNHMLEQLSKHSLVDLSIQAKGDVHIDDHHTIEDVGLVIGEVISRALSERKGIRRYGFLLPMDDTLVEVAIDLGGRPYLVFNCDFKREKVGDLRTEMGEHFFRSVAETLKANIHINVKYSKNEHHKIEAIFKAFAKALRMATERDPRQKNILPSTKGVL